MNNHNFIYDGSENLECGHSSLHLPLTEQGENLSLHLPLTEQGENLSLHLPLTEQGENLSLHLPLTEQDELEFFYKAAGLN